MRHAFITIWIVTVSLISFATGQSDIREVVVCSDSKDGKTITCKNGPIYIRSATVLTLQSWDFCELSELKPRLGNVPPGCKLDATGVYETCHGKQTCTLQRWMAETVLGAGQCVNGDQTNVLHITHSCFNVSDSSATFLPVRTPVIAKSFNIFSPFYPCKMPNIEHSLTCTISKNSTVAPTTMSLYIEIVRLTFGTSGHCWEDLAFGTTGAKTDLLQNYCSGEERETWRRHHLTNFITSLEIQYSSKLDSDNDAGMFWIKVQNAIAGQDIAYKLTCTATAKNMSEQAADGCKSFRDELVIFEHDPTTKSVTTQSPTLTSQPITRDDDDDDNSLAYGLVGFAIAAIIIIAIIAVVCILRGTGGKDKELDKERASTTHVQSVNGVTTTAYSSDGQIDRMNDVQDTKYEKKRKSRGSKKDRNSKGKHFVAAAVVPHSSGRSSRQDDDFEDTKRHSEAPEEYSRTTTPSVHDRPPSSVHDRPPSSVHERPPSSVHDRPPSSVHDRPPSSVHDRPPSSVHDRPPSSVHDRPPSSVHDRPPSSVHEQPPSEHERPTSYAYVSDSNRDSVADVDDRSTRPESNISDIGRESREPEEISRTNTPSFLAVPAQGRPASYHSAAESDRIDDNDDAPSTRPQSEVPYINEPEDVSRTNTPSLLAVPAQGRPASTVSAAGSSRMSGMDDASTHPDDLSEINRQSEVPDVDEHSITPPDPTYSSVGEVPAQKPHDYTRLTGSEDADDINRQSDIHDRDSYLQPSEFSGDDGKRDTLYEDTYAVVDKSQKRASSSVYQSDNIDTVPYENVEVTGLKGEESVTTDLNKRDSELLY